MKYRLLLAFSVIVLVLLGLMQVTGCTVVTDFTEHRISKVADDAPDGVDIVVSFGTSRRRKMVIPGIRDREEYRDPFSVYFTVWGPFDSISSVTASMSINGEVALALPVDVVALNKNRKLSRNSSPLFPGGKIETLTDGDIETVVVTTSMTVVSGGETKNYVIINRYEMQKTERTGNRWFSALMSV